MPSTSLLHFFFQFFLFFMVAKSSEIEFRAAVILTFSSLITINKEIKMLSYKIVFYTNEFKGNIIGGP